MTVFRASGLALVAAVVVAGAAAAQAPVPLTPQPAAPRPERPAAAMPAGQPGPTGGPVTVDALKAVDPDSVGTIGDSQGGLGVDLWRGTSRSVAAGLLQALPAPLESPAMRSLARRLLRTTATAPEGKSDDGPLLLHRVVKLIELGDPAAAVELARAAPAAASDERLVQAEVEALFFGNDNAGACARVRALIADRPGDYWQQALAYCLALAGESEKAALIADLLRERPGAAPAAFFAAMEAIGGDRNAKIDALAQPTALVLAMLRTANRKLPESLDADRRAAVARFVALSPNADLATRLGAAERAAAAGAVTPAELGEIYGAVPFAPNELANPLAEAESQWGPRGRALLLRAALIQTVPAARAEVLQKGWRLGRGLAGAPAAGRALAPALDTIAPAPDLMWFAADAGAALYRRGRIAEARAWYDAVEAAAPTDPAAARAWVVLWPLAALASPNASWDAGLLGKWREAQVAQGDSEAARALATRLFALFEAFGRPVPPEAWSGLVRGARPVEAAMPDPAVWYALDRAAREGRRGEAVALALIALGASGPAAASPMVLGAAVSSLRRIGLDADARILALEAAGG
jgi:hypothetical protein